MDKFIKILSVLLSFVLLFSSLILNENSFIFAEEESIGYISKTDVNVREKSSVSSKSLAEISEIYVNVLDSKSDSDKQKNPETNKVYVWYKISFIKDNKTITGYVREDLIEITEISVDSDFEKLLKDFPESYHSNLKILHSLYPNWKFTADKVPQTFSQAVNSQDYLFYKLVQSKYNSFRSMRKGCYNWNKKTFVETDSGGWYGASREVIAYYMDPRNFLDTNNIYQYMVQTYDKKSQDLNGVKKIVKDTFLDAKINDKKDEFNDKHFAEVIIEAADESNVNPYVLASTILQEQGTNGSSLSKGKTYKNTTVYNFFNYGATGNTNAEVLENGLKYAYNKGWKTRSKAIIDGAVLYSNGYISDGQDTYFYKNYNVLNPEEIWHQYAQNVADSLNSSKFLKTAYSEQKDLILNFKIPVYRSIPDTISALPSKNDKLNNYYFENISVNGLTPSFDKYTYEYSLSLSKSTTIKLTLPKGAKLYNDDKISLKKGDNEVKIGIISQTGYVNIYTINVDAEKSCKLTLKTDENEQSNSSSLESSSSSKDTSSTEKKIVLGDTNSDKTVDIIDLANIRLHLLEKIELKKDNFNGADTDKDSEITIIDLANLRLHLLEIIKLK